MNRKLLVAGLSACGALLIPAASASAVVIGGSSQTSGQAINSTQGANASTATGSVIVVGGGAAGPTPTQSSTNVESSGQAVGSAGGGDIFISPTGVGPTQLSTQGANSGQISTNGAIGEQDSANLLDNSQIVGGDQSCMVGPCVSSVIIGSPTQVSQQGVNSSQGADGGVTTGNIIVTPMVVVNGPAGPIFQTSLNTLVNDQLVLG